MIFGFLLVGKQRFSRDREIAESGVHLTPRSSVGARSTLKRHMCYNVLHGRIKKRGNS